MFTGLDPEAISFFAELRLENTTQWWAANKRRYDEHVRGPMEALGAELEPEFGPVKIFRPNRDVRFSADKSPYKLQIGMVSQGLVTRYLQLSEEGLAIGGGRYQLPPAALARFRELVDDPRVAEDLDAVLAEVGAAGFALRTADSLRTAPRGFPVDHPRIELLRLRRLAVGIDEGIADWMWTPDAFDAISAHWRTVSIWCDWLQENLGPELAAQID